MGQTGSKTKSSSRPRRQSRAERAAAERRRALRQRIGFALVAVATVAVLAVVVLIGGEGGEDEVAPSRAGEVEVAGPVRAAPVGVGEPIPDFSAPGLQGGRVAWEDLGGGPRVLAVWAPWCPHCQVELPILGRVAREFPDVTVMTVVSAIGQSPGPDPASFMADNALTFPTAVDDEATTILRGLGIQGFPTVFYVGSDGRVVRVTSGETDEQTMRELFGSLATS